MAKSKYYVIGFALVIGFILFFGNNKIQDQNEIIIESEKIIELLVIDRIVEKQISDSLKRLYKHDPVNPYEVELKIKQAYYEKIDSIDSLSIYDQLGYLSDWLSKRDSI